MGRRRPRGSPVGPRRRPVRPPAPRPGAPPHRRGARLTRDAQRQFGRQAALYATSVTHGAGESLTTFARLVGDAPLGRALDVATGAGFAACAVAAHAAEVLATDLTAEMLAEARRLAAARGLPHVRFARADAERLPFRDAAFDLVTCRIAAHHFTDVRRAVAEMARVCAPGGAVVVQDTTAPEDPELGRTLDDWERWRDPTHVHDLAPSEWRAVLADAGLVVEAVGTSRTPVGLADWTRRAGTPPDTVTRLDAALRAAPPGARAAFGIHAEGDDVHFHWDNTTLRARKRGTP